MLEHTASRQAEEDIGPFNNVAQRAGRCFLCKHNFVFVHQLGAAFVHHTGQVGHINILTRNAQFDQEAKAGQRRCARAAGDQFDLFRVFADYF